MKIERYRRQWWHNVKRDGLAELALRPPVSVRLDGRGEEREQGELRGPFLSRTAGFVVGALISLSTMGGVVLFGIAVYYAMKWVG